MNRSLTSIALLVSLHGFAPPAQAAGLEPPRSGWASWEVPAVAAAPAWCCFEAQRTPPAKAVCKLDDKDHGYGSRNDATTDTVRIYARFADGKLERLRALSADCPVQVNAQILALSPSEQTSVEWLAARLADDTAKRLRSELMAALAVHRTASAYDVLARSARQGPRFDDRKDAVFWLAHVRGREGAELTTALMFEDTDARMREHAAFALTQSSSPRIAEDLMRLARTDRAGKVRGQAWFWLAHTAAAQTERAIEAALRAETDREVREQAIFALSQLPDDRATGALIAVAENRDLPREDRKRAIFWLAQQGSDSALAYIDRVVNAARR